MTTERRHADAVWRCSPCNVPLVYDYHVVWRCPSCGACFTIAPGLTVSLPTIEISMDASLFNMSAAQLIEMLKTTGPGANFSLVEPRPLPSMRISG